LFDQLLYLFLGWCLGLLGPIIIDRIRRDYRVAELMRAIVLELHELQYRMALATYFMRKRLGIMPDDWLAWLESIVRSYTGPEPHAGILEAIVAFRSHSPEERRQALLIEHDPTRGLSLKEYTVPLLSAHVADISLFPVPFQVAALRVKGHLDMFNQHVRYLQGQFEKTFNAADQNYDTIRSNLDNGYQELGEIAKRIADAVSCVPSPKARKSAVEQKTVNH
jgi:hypothetical protein